MVGGHETARGTGHLRHAAERVELVEVGGARCLHGDRTVTVDEPSDEASRAVQLEGELRVLAEGVPDELGDRACDGLRDPVPVAVVAVGDRRRAAARGRGDPDEVIGGVVGVSLGLARARDLGHVAVAVVGPGSDSTRPLLVGDLVLGVVAVERRACPRCVRHPVSVAVIAIGGVRLRGLRCRLGPRGRAGRSGVAGDWVPVNRAVVDPAPPSGRPRAGEGLLFVCPRRSRRRRPAPGRRRGRPRPGSLTRMTPRPRTRAAPWLDEVARQGVVGRGRLAEGPGRGRGDGHRWGRSAAGAERSQPLDRRRSRTGWSSSCRRPCLTWLSRLPAAS